MMSARYPSILATLFTLSAVARAGTVADSPSPFVRAQAGSAVHWNAWDPETLERAAKQDKPVYVFVASELSGLSRATIAQTFVSAKTVAWLNESFFCIFVDEDTQPVVGAYAQHFINSAKQLSGSPVHLWLTPGLRPYEGANYLPPSEEWGRPGFLKVANSALETFKTGSERTKALADEAASMMAMIPLGRTKAPGLKERLEKATAAWSAAVDSTNGGFGTAPKNPEPELIRFMIARGGAAKDVGIAAARALVSGSVRDTTDSGFYRRAIDEAWKEPFRQKTLLDQARIALALFDAADAANDEKLRAAGNGALEFTLKKLQNGDGSFAAALDATDDTNTDPGHRPEFRKVGRASVGSLGLLMVALKRAGGAWFEKTVGEVDRRVRLNLGMDGSLPHVNGYPAEATAWDYMAAALASKAVGSESLAHTFISRANKRYFDPKLGRYMATAADLPAGIQFRAPVSNDPPSAESLALLNDIDPTIAGQIRTGILIATEYDDQPPGDALLGLAH